MSPAPRAGPVGEHRHGLLLVAGHDRLRLHGHHIRGLRGGPVRGRQPAHELVIPALFSDIDMFQSTFAVLYSMMLRFLC